MENLDIQKPILSINPKLAFFTGKILSWFVNDVVITKEEIDGLTSNLLYIKEAGHGDTLLSEWVAKNKNTLGNNYTSELKKR